MSYHELVEFRGDTWHREFTVLKADGETPQDVTGATLRFTAKANRDDVASVVSGTTGDGRCTIAAAAAGRVRVKIPPAVTALLAAPAQLWFDFQAQDGAGDVWTFAHGKIKVRADIGLTVP